MFFNAIPTRGLGKKNNLLQQAEVVYGQAKILLNANPLNGNLFIKDFTKSLTTQGFQLDIGYVYNSQSQTPWKLNQGKTISSIQGELNKPNSFLVVEEADGHESIYTYTPDRNCYVNLSETGGSSTLTYNASEEVWSGWSPAKNIQENYNKNNQIEKIIDSSGNFLSYEYDNTGRLINIKDITGLRLSIEYSLNQIKINAHEDNNKTLLMHYFFNENQLLTQTSIPIAGQEYYDINYHYTDESNLLEQINQSDQTEVSFSYEGNYLSSVTSGEEYTFLLHYQGNSTLISDPLDNDYFFSKNEADLLAKYVHNEQIQEYYYDDLDRIESIHYSDETEKKFTYDTLGFYSQCTGRQEEKKLYHHHPLTGLILCETEFASDKELNTFYIYNNKQQIAFKIQPHGAVHSYSYDKKGNRTKELVYLEQVFDTSNLTRKSIIPFETIQEWCTQQNKTAVALTEWTYNLYGQISTEMVYANSTEDGIGIQDQYAAYHEFEWTIHGDLHTKKRKLNEQETAIESLHYDGLSRPIQFINPLGQITQHVYEKNQHQIIFQPTGLITTQIWNKSGFINLEEQNAPEYSLAKSFIYDNGGRVCLIKQEQGAEEYFIYDECNRVIFQIDSLMRVIQKSYDKNDYLLHQWRYAEPLKEVNKIALIAGNYFPQPTGDYCLESTFYDANGKLLGFINGDNYLTQHHYDTHGNVKETIKYANPYSTREKARANLDKLPQIIESEEDKHHYYFYNKAHELIGEQFPSGQVIAYQRTTLGDLKTLTTSLGSLPKITHWNEDLLVSIPTKKESYQLDSRGQCKEHINAESIKKSFLLDAEGRIIASNCGEENTRFTWDLMSRLIEEQHSSGLQIIKAYAHCGKVASELKKDLLADTRSRNRHTRYNAFGQETHELSPRMTLKLEELELTNNSNLIEALWQNESLRHFYSATGLTRKTQDELGNTHYFYYNSEKELCFSISPTGGITEFTYEAIHHLPETIRHYTLVLNQEELACLEGGLLTSTLTAFFHAKKNEHDAVNKTKYNNRGLEIVTIDAEHYVTNKNYDGFNNLIFIQQQINEQQNLIHSMTYDKADRPLLTINDLEGIKATEHWIYKDEEGLIIHTDQYRAQRKTYKDKLGRIIKEINGLNHEAHFTWDELSRLKETTDALNNITTLTYKNHGRTIVKSTPLTTSLIEKNAFGEFELECNADNEIKKSVFDVDGQIKTYIDAEGNQQDYEYNNAGWLTKLSSPSNKTLEYKHNKSGHIEQQIERGANNELRVSLFKRDSQGRELERITEHQHLIKTIRDKRGLETEHIIDPEGLTLHTHKQYDGLEHVVLETKGSAEYPNQLTTQWIYDPLERLINQIIDPDQIKLSNKTFYHDSDNYILYIDPNNHQSYSCYDVERQERYFIDPLGCVVGKQYDANGQCIEERHYAIPLDLNTVQHFAWKHLETLLKPSEDDKVIYYAYDAEGHKIASLNEHNKLTCYSYNAQGKKIHEISYATALNKTDFMIKTPSSTGEDRQCAWFYDKLGNERFKINGEGGVSEQCWNEQGWLIEERTYARAYFDYTHCPRRELLEHPDDRFTRYIHNDFGQVIFEINAEGYVTEHEYDRSEKPTKSWFYPEQIKIPTIYTLESIRNLLSSKEHIPSIETYYDAALRTIETRDQLGYKETFKLDSLGNLREYQDKGGDSWTFAVDGANRLIEEATPPIEITSVTEQGQLIPAVNKQRIIKKIEYQSDIQIVTEAYGTPEARALELHHNAAQQLVKTVQCGVTVDDKNKVATQLIENYFSPTESNYAKQSSLEILEQQQGILLFRPEEEKNLSSRILYNSFKKPIVIIDEAGNAQFKIYYINQLRYEVDQEGFVTETRYNVFGNAIQLIRYALTLDLNLSDFTSTGIPLTLIEATLKKSPQDRPLFFKFDRANRPTQITQAPIFTYIPQIQAKAHYGFCSPIKSNEYNSFGEIYSERELVDPFNDVWNENRTWFNKIGHPIAQVDGLNYLSTHVTDRFGNNKKTIEYANTLNIILQKESTLQEVVQGIEADADNDRLYTSEINARNEITKTIQHKVCLYDPEVDPSNLANLFLSLEPQNIEHQFLRNAKGLLEKEIVPNGTEKITLYNARNLPVLKTEAPRQLANGLATPVITMGYNAFGQPTRITHHANPYEAKAYLIPHPEDQIYLAGFDIRGLQIVTVEPEGAIHYQNFTETKKLASSWIWVQGWGDKNQLIRRLHQTHYEYDKRGIETLRIESIESGATIKTATQSNAFGEKIAEGSGDGFYPIYWLRDRTGRVWNTNEQNGVPVITLSNATGQETLNARSRTRSLKEVTSLEQLEAIMELDYTHLQRLESERDVKGTIRTQASPAFRMLPLNAPEPIQTEVSSGTSYPSFGKASLTWPVPDIAGLEAEASLWPKGRKEEIKSLTVNTIAARCGIDVSAFPTDEYDYQIDFYYRDPQTKQRDAYPCYRAEGNCFIATEILLPTSNLIWQQTDESHLTLYGHLNNISGVELRENGRVIGQVAISDTEKAHCWTIDLSSIPSGRYEFHWLRGYSLLEENPITLGAVSVKGTKIDSISTQLNQTLDLYLMNFNTVISSSWSNIPPQISTLYHELTVANASHPYPSQDTILVNYSTQISCIDSAIKNKSRSYTIHNSFYLGLKSMSRFSANVVRNRLYVIDSNKVEHTIAEVIKPHSGVPSFNANFLYVQPGPDLPRVDALREHFNDGHLGKTIALSPWMNRSSRCPALIHNTNTAYDLISLQASFADPIPCGEISIHTANTQSKELLVREITLSEVCISKIKTNINYQLMHYDKRIGLNFKWNLPDDLTNKPLKVQFKLNFRTEVFQKTYGNYTFEYQVGRSSEMPYNGHLVPISLGGATVKIPAFTDFDLKSLKLYVQYNNEWIVLLDTTSFKFNSAQQSKKSNITIKSHDGWYSGTRSISQYIEGGTATTENTHTLLFYPMPSGIDSKTICLEYKDTTLVNSAWRALTKVYHTGQILSASATVIASGTYQYRLKAKNIRGEAINFSQLAPETQGDWALGFFNVTHGGILTKTKSAPPSQELVRPLRMQSTDRWGNIINSTNALGNTTQIYYNGRNKALKKIDPAVEITEKNGLKKIANPKTYTLYDLSDNIIGLIDANGHKTIHERDNDGKTLKTTFADGVFKQSIPDIFGRTHLTRDPFNKESSKQYDRCNRQIAYQDPCHWKTKFSYNELGDRLAVVNGNLETERYDYLHPSRQVTHYYLAEETNPTRKEYERHGVLIKEELSDQRCTIWETDAFGNIIAHSDLGGARYTYQNNPYYPTELTQITSSGGQHGTRLSADGSTQVMPNQNLIYQYDEASHEIAILDNTLPLTTQYRFDLAGRRARETFIGFDGHIYQSVLMKWNALDWLSEVRDNKMLVKYSQDAKGNRRSTIASLYWNEHWDPIGEENWYLYNEADKIIISRGLLKNNLIQIGPNKGTALLYDIGGRRQYECTLTLEAKEVKKKLVYLDNNLLKQTVTLSDNKINNYEYDKQVARRTLFTTGTKEHHSYYNHKGWVEREKTFNKTDQTTADTVYKANRIGLPTEQNTKVRNKEGTDGYDDHIKTIYAPFESDKVLRVEGTRQRVGGDQSHSLVQIGYDPNGNTEVVLGDNQEPRTFITNCKNRIVQKKQGPINQENYFYTTSDQPLGRFGTISPEGFTNRPSDIDFDLNYHPVSEHFPPPTPSRYIVNQGDSFTSISERMYGDQSFGDLIAEANGYRLEESPPTGLNLTIPNLVNTNIHNWDGQYSIYNPTAIIGSLYPNMPIPNRMVVTAPPPLQRSHKKFWHILIKAIASTAIMAFAPEFAGVFAGVFSELIGEALGFALAGAASNLVQQEMAIALGDQSKFSLSALGQSALLATGTAGIGKGLGLDFIKAPQYQHLVNTAVQNIELTKPLKV